jgi:VanZ family protein
VSIFSAQYQAAIKAKTTLFPLILFSLFIIYGTTIPFDFSNVHSAKEKLLSISLNPFLNADKSRISLSDVVQNILLFIPIGLLGGVFIRSCKRINIFIGDIIIIIYGILLSASVETLQLFSLTRVTSLNDVLTNTTGVIVGLLCTSITFKLLQAIKQNIIIASLLQIKSFYPFVLLLIGIIIETLQPFDFAIDPSLTFSRIKNLIHYPVSFNFSLHDDIWAITLYISLGFFTYKCISEIRYNNARKYIISAIFFMPLILEGMQFIIVSRMPEIFDITVAVLSLVVGMCSNKIIGKKRLICIISLVFLYSASVVCKLFYPFKIISTHTPFILLPFSAEYAHTTMIALGNTFETFVVFVFGGYFIFAMLSCLQPYFRMIIILSFIIMICILEYLQGWIYGRYPDVSDIITEMISLFIGIYLYKKIEKK